MLGWSYDDHTEIFSLQDLVEKFDIHRIQVTNARFSPEKLEWMNGYYINHVLTEDDFARRSLPFLVTAGLLSEDEATAAQADPERWQFIVAACKLAKDKAKTLLDVAPEIEFAFKSVESLDYPVEDLIGKNAGKEGAAAVLEGLIKKLESMSAEQYNHKEGILEVSNALGEEMGVKLGLIMWPPRVALSGKTKSPGCPEMMILLGRDETIKRFRYALSKLNA
jgi:glutamyl-tRNA synthetase